MHAAVIGIIASREADVEFSAIQTTFPFAATIFELNGNLISIGFIGTAPYPSYAYTSTDAVTWTRTTGPNAEYRGASAAEGPDRVVITGGNSAASTRNAVTVDGVSWTHYTNMPSSGYWYGTAYEPNTARYLSCEYYASSTIATSVDGITWSNMPTSGKPAIEALAYGNGMLLAGHRNSSSVFRSVDGGSTWSSIGARPYQFTVLRFMHDRFFATPLNFPYSSVSSTFDGITWTSHPLPLAAGWRTPVWVPSASKWILIGNQSGVSYIYTSSDLSSWSSVAVPSQLQGSLGPVLPSSYGVVGLSFPNSSFSYSYRVTGL